MLAERTEKVCEMAAVMKEAAKVDEENTNLQQEAMARLMTENKGLRERMMKKRSFEEEDESFETPMEQGEIEDGRIGMSSPGSSGGLAVARMKRQPRFLTKDLDRMPMAA